MGSDRHYPEEASAHRVTVDESWIDRAPVTIDQFCAFVGATGYVTLAGRPLKATDYPGVQRRMLNPGSLVFAPPDYAIAPGDWSQWWTLKFGASWRRPTASAPRVAISTIAAAKRRLYHGALKPASGCGWRCRSASLSARCRFICRCSCNGYAALIRLQPASSSPPHRRRGPRPPSPPPERQALGRIAWS